MRFSPRRRFHATIADAAARYFVFRGMLLRFDAAAYATLCYVTPIFTAAIRLARQPDSRHATYCQKLPLCSISSPLITLSALLSAISPCLRRRPPIFDDYASHADVIDA